MIVDRKPEHWVSQTLAGLLCILSGVAFYWILLGYEASPDDHFKVAWPVALAYALGGKLAVAGGFAAIGILLSGAAILRALRSVHSQRQDAAQERKAMEDVASLVREGRRIEAMKLYRALTGASLQDALSAIQEIERSGQDIA